MDIYMVRGDLMPERHDARLGAYAHIRGHIRLKRARSLSRPGIMGPTSKLLFKWGGRET